MKPGDPSVISGWLFRSQKVPLTVIAGFNDSYEHPPCSYQDSATAILTDGNDLGACHRHEAVLSLDQLLPRRSRIPNLSILFHSSDPHWDDVGHEGGSILLYYHFFRGTLPNSERLDFRAVDVEYERHAISITNTLFVGKLPHLKEFKYLGVTGGLAGTVKNLTSCETGL